MARNGQALRQANRGKRMPEKYEGREFPKGKSGIIICPECHAYLFKKKWKHADDSFIQVMILEGMSVKYDLCFADKMIQQKQFEGEVVVCNVPKEYQDQVVALIRAYCHRAYLKDPMDKLISVSQGQKIRVRLTENQTAQKLGKKIKETFKAHKISFIHSKEPNDVERVVVNFNG